MRVRFALLAEYANITQDGKLNLLGLLERIFAYEFPALHRELYVIHSFETEPEDDDAAHDIRVSIIDPDGQIVAEAGGQLSIQGGRQIINQIHVFQDLPFSVPGGYQVNLFVNDRMMASLDLELLRAPTAAPEE